MTSGLFFASVQTAGAHWLPDAVNQFEKYHAIFGTGTEGRQLVLTLHIIKHFVRCVCACVRTCVRAWVRVCVCVWVWVI